MTHPKPSNSSLRYFLAGLKPLGSIKVWGSVGLMGVVSLSLWYYSRHPEWLGADTIPPQDVGGEVEAEVGNSVDMGVTLQDLQNNQINRSRTPQNAAPNQGTPFDDPLKTAKPPTPMLSDPFLDPPSAPQNFNNKNKGKKPSVGFQPLIPSFKDLGSLFPPLTPSKNSSRPIKIPDRVLDTPKPQTNALKDALDNLDSSPTPPVESPTLRNNQTFDGPVRPARPNYSTIPNSRDNTYPNSTYPQPYNPAFPNNSPQTSQQPYTNTQPYSYPYGNGTVPAPIPAYPSSQTPNPNNPRVGNQRPQQNNYGIQPPQVGGNEGIGYY